MRRTKQWILILLGVSLMLSLFGCGKAKYKLNFDDDWFQSKKTVYAAGEKVTVYYDMIATDTDYHFWLDDESVKMTQGYDDKHGYSFTFLMPAHDVTLHVESHNSMEYRPEIEITFVNEVTEADLWVLLQTEENLKASLWGTATVGQLEKGEAAEFFLEESYVADTWLVRIIDADQAYYAAQDLVLEDGYQIVFRSEDTKFEAVIEVLDRDGTVIFSKPAYIGVL